jgi:uncharacterized protein with von Willebrand factor type A (vWA) domain
MTNKKTFDPNRRKKVTSCDSNVGGKLAELEADLHDAAFLAERGCLAKGIAKRTYLREVCMTRDVPWARAPWLYDEAL